MSTLAAGCATGRPEWVDAPPRRCAVGQSGPTLNPVDSLGYAQEDARAALVQRERGIRVLSLWEDVPGGDPFSVSLQTVSGVAERVVIVSMWPDADSMFALACTGTPPVTEPEGDLPAWVYNVPGDRLCALGASGPTLRAEDRVANAEDDARERLAAAVEANVRKTVLDEEGRGATVATAQEPSRRAQDEVRRRGRVVARWLDAAGAGPLRRRGTLYTLACLW